MKTNENVPTLGSSPLGQNWGQMRHKQQSCAMDKLCLVCPPRLQALWRPQLQQMPLCPCPRRFMRPTSVPAVRCHRWGWWAPEVVFLEKSRVLTLLN